MTVSHLKSIFLNPKHHIFTVNSAIMSYNNNSQATSSVFSPAAKANTSMHKVTQSPQTQQSNTSESKSPRQAGLPDVLPLVLIFWYALWKSVCRVVFTAVSSRYGIKLPDKLEDMTGLVVASINDDNFFFSSYANTGSSSVTGLSKAYERDFKRSVQPSLADKDSYESSEFSASNKKPSTHCIKPCFHGHKCDEVHEVKKQKVSRMAVRDTSVNSGEVVVFGTSKDQILLKKMSIFG